MSTHHVTSSLMKAGDGGRIRRKTAAIRWHSRDFTVKFFTTRAPKVINDEPRHHGGAHLPPSDHDALQPVTPPPEEQEQAAPEFASPLEDDEERRNVFHDGTPIRYRRINDVIGDEPVPGKAERVLLPPRRGQPRRVQEELHLTTREGEPASFAEAEQDKAWRATMQDEIKSIEDNRT
jgi:hypothetical protein